MGCTQLCPIKNARVHRLSLPATVLRVRNAAPCSPCHVQLLGVLRGALALGNPKLAEPALSCMHKLVAYAYLQGETGPSGRLDDDSSIVTQAGEGAGAGWWQLLLPAQRARPHGPSWPGRHGGQCQCMDRAGMSRWRHAGAVLATIRDGVVLRSSTLHGPPLQVVALTAKCGESSTAGTQLQVVKALLTYVTGKAGGGLRAAAGRVALVCLPSTHPPCSSTVPLAR